MKKIYIVFLVIAIAFLTYFIDSVVGNPLYKSLATSYAKQVLTTQFADTEYELETIGFNYDTKMYDYIVKRPHGKNEIAYALTINSKLSDRTLHSFAVHPSVADEALSARLSTEAKPHVTNIVRQVFEDASIEYKLSIPKGIMPINSTWTPGLNLDLNATIHVNQTVGSWNPATSNEKLQQLKEALLQNGIHFSRVGIRITEEYEKEGITYMKTVLKDEIYEHEG